MDEFPLRPPFSPMPLALDWILARAFGPHDGVVVAPDPEMAFHLASQLSLGSRIGGRAPFELLVDDLGGEGAEDFRRRYRLTAAAVLLQQELCRSLAAKAQDLDVAVVFLKGAALNLGDAVPVGLRESSDIDLLLAPPDAEALAAALKADGWTSDDVPLGEQHLQPLSHPDGLGAVELHWRITGFRVSGQGSASFEDLQEAGLLVPLESMPGSCFRLSDEAQIAHLLTHALGQHLWFPGSYPQLRFLADLMDLDFDAKRWTEIGDIVKPWIELDVDFSVLDAAMELLARLRVGEDPAEIWAGDAPSGLYLRHVILGWLQPEYAESIRFRSVSRGLRQPEEKAMAGWRLVKQTFWLTRGQVDKLYGKPGGALGYLGWRLYRPVDVVRRLLRYGGSWASLRLKSGRKSGD